MKRLVVWWRWRRFLMAYRTLRNEAERHNAAGHDVYFSVVNPGHVTLECTDCPWLDRPVAL